MPTGWDHLVVVAFAIVLPALAKHNFSRLKRAVDSGIDDARARQYRTTILRQWSLAAFALSVWLHAGRPFAELGLSAPAGSGFVVGLGVALALGTLWRRLFRSAMEDPDGRARLIEQLHPLRVLLPHTPRELSLFTALSVTAGICEELLFRGFLLWYTSQYVGLTGGCVASSVAFGLGHLYQGPRQAVKIIVLGGVLVLFAVGTGSLWIPMALHAFLDAAQGRLAYRLLATRDEAR